MYGAILGDIIGSPYEFDMGDKTKDFPLFSKYSHFTDDTVLTIAIGEALAFCKRNYVTNPNIIKTIVSINMKDYAKRYPHAGYGARFIGWLNGSKNDAYNSCGNGAAMRVSSIPYIYKDFEQALNITELVTEITHNHPEGIKGAKATVTAMWLALNGASKDEIKKTIIDDFGYDLNRTCDEIRPTYHHVETCQETVPEAIIAFLESNSFEDAIRNAVSLGGDTDTLACITGSIAEAYYGVPNELKKKCEEMITNEFRHVVHIVRGE